jgi:hypothetical protein
VGQAKKRPTKTKHSYHVTEVAETSLRPVGVLSHQYESPAFCSGHTFRTYITVGPWAGRQRSKVPGTTGSAGSGRRHLVSRLRGGGCVGHVVSTPLGSGWPQRGSRVDPDGQVHASGTTEVSGRCSRRETKIGWICIDGNWDPACEFSVSQPRNSAKRPTYMQVCRPFGKVLGGCDVPVVTVSSFPFHFAFIGGHCALILYSRLFGVSCSSLVIPNGHVYFRHVSLIHE